jgi:hypothetical protein
MRAIAAVMGLGMLLASASAWAQENSQAPEVAPTQPIANATSPDYTAVYCSNYYTSDRGNDDTFLISGEQSNTRIVFTVRDRVFINKGSSQGIRVGDRFTVSRPDADPNDVQWFQWQHKLAKAMGTLYRDAGQLKVINVQPNVSTAEVTFACGYLQRGDLVRPFQERPGPPYKPAAKFDRFAPISGKSVGMLVVGKDYSQTYGKFSTVYVNLGANQGVSVGDYFRVFRYQGSHAETSQYLPDYQYKILGFGSDPARYQWNDIPREIIGEGVVLNVSPNSSTVLITLSHIELFAGDYVEVE